VLGSATEQEASPAVSAQALVDLREFRYFSTLADELHFGRAAERLHISQSPLSQAISNLEHKLGTSLFDRANRPIKLTPAGEVLLGHARRILAEADDAVGAARRAAEGETGTLRMAVDRSMTETLMPQLRHGLAERFPELRLEVVEAPANELVDVVRRGAADVGLAVCPEDADGIDSRVVRRERAVALVHKTNPLANRAAIDLEELARHPLLIWPQARSNGSHEFVLSLFHWSPPASVATIDVSDGRWWSEMLSGSFMVVPEGTARTPDFVTVPIAKTGDDFVTRVVWSGSTPPSFLDELLDALDDVSAALGWV
jgi:DNA-binding transcriptional LysR family regulator